MRKTVLLLACLACAGYAQPLETAKPAAQLNDESKTIAARALAALMLASDEKAAFNPSVSGMHLPVGAADTQTRLGQISPVMGEDMRWRRKRDETNRVLLIDGNNLMGQKRVTKGRIPLMERLRNIKLHRPVLVWDGAVGEQASVEGTDPMIVITQGADENGNGGKSADEWILNEVKTRPEKYCTVVSGDKDLVRAVRKVPRGYQKQKVMVIHPVRFWRRYVARLTGLKGRKEKIIRAEKMKQREARLKAAAQAAELAR
mmetsp:Transcript_129748/g.211271  ORF Transcript_129748/g.211271 Transcript_129748/m.211271 type:complete len:259 (+) Transcript_129748:59-835(+)